jgi:hypothetical protein
MTKGGLDRARGPQAGPQSGHGKRVSQLELGQMLALLFGEL